MKKKRPTTYLLLDGDCLTLVRSDEEDDVFELNYNEAFDIGEFQRKIDEYSLVGNSFVIALSAYDCLCSPIEIVDPRMLRNRQMLEFALEEQLPVAAEEFVADFVTSNNSALGVAGEVSTLERVISAVLESDCSVHSVVPASLMVLRQLEQTCKFASEQIVVVSHAFTEFFLLGDKKLVGWTIVENELPQILLESEFHVGQFKDPPPIMWVSESDTNKYVRSALEHYPDIQTGSDSFSFREALLNDVAFVSNNKLEPPVNLLRPPLGVSNRLQTVQRYLNWVAAAVFALLLALVFFFQFRADEYRKIANRYQGEQQAIFTDLFPTQQIPVGIKARLEVELNTRQGVSDDQQLPSLDSAYDSLARVLVGLTNELRFRVTSIRIEAGVIDIQGEARKHSDVETIVSGIRKRGFEIQAPRTEALPNEGVSFHIAGRLNTAPEA